MLIVAVIIVLVGGVTCFVHFMDKSSNNEVKESTDKSDGTVDNKEDTNSVSEEEEKDEQENEDTQEYDFETQTGEDVKVEANKVVTATGFSGASNYKFYLRGTTLYFRDVSVSDNEEEILAYNVKDLYLENKEVVAVLYSDGEIVKENNYITYK